MADTAKNRHTIGSLFEHHETLSLAVVLSLPVVAFDQFLHTSAAQFSAAPALQVFRWVSDILMALPLFAAATWGGQMIADRAGLGVVSRRDIVKRAMLISGPLALLLIPGWFAYNELASLTQGTELVAAHTHGPARSTDAYWVGDRVVYALLLAPLVVLVGWAGYRMTAGLWVRLGQGIRTLARASVVVTLLAGVAAVAWFLHQAANRADSSRVYYTSAVQSAFVHSHAFFAADHAAHPPPAGPAAAAAPFSFAYQVARALQDGLIAQVVGMPVAALALLCAAWLLRDRDTYQQFGFEQKEVANR